MRKSIKYFLGFLSILALLIFGVIYYVSTKLSNEDVKSFLVLKIKETMPGTRVSIKQVDYSLGFAINFKVQDLDIKLKKNKPGGELFFVSKAFIRVPLWAIFSKGGIIDIIISSPQVNYYEYQNGLNNWGLGKSAKRVRRLNKKTVPPQTDGTEGGLDQTISLPIFFSKSKINIRSDNITVFYQTKEDIKGEFTVSKFLVKNISLNESAAFEMQSSIKITLPQERVFSSNILLIGEFDTPNFLEEGLLKSKAEVRLTDNKLSGFSFSIPDSRADIFLFSKQNDSRAELKLNLGDLLDMRANILMGKTIQVDKLNAHFHLVPILKSSGISIKGLKLNDTKINISGAVRLSERPILNLKLKSINKIQYSLLKGPIDIGLLGTIRKRRVGLNIPLETLSGTGVIAIQTMLPPDITTVSLQNLSGTKLKLSLDRIKIAEEEIRQLIYSERKQVSDQKIGSKNPSLKSVRQGQTRPFFIPNFQLRLSGKRMIIGKSQFKFNGLIMAQDNILQSRGLSVSVGKRKTKINFMSKMGLRSVSTKFDLNIQKVPVESFRFILPQYLNQVSGIATTKLGGNLAIGENSLKYDIKLNSLIAHGGIENLKINDFVTDYVRNIPILDKQISKKDINISNKFKQFVIKGRFKETHYQVQKLDFIGNQNKIRIKGKGNLFPLSKKRKGAFFLTFKDNKGKIGKQLKKNIGTNVIPVRLAGNGFALKPDYSYTAKKIAKSTVRAQGKKVLKKQGKKLLNKYLKGNKKKQAEKLLKGLFK